MTIMNFDGHVFHKEDVEHIVKYNTDKTTIKGFFSKRILIEYSYEIKIKLIHREIIISYETEEERDKAFKKLYNKIKDAKHIPLKDKIPSIVNVYNNSDDDDDDEMEI